MTQSAATCLFNSVAMSPIGHLELDENATNTLFNVTDIKTDTTSIAAHIPLFQKKIGPNKPLTAKLDFSDIKVTLG